MTEFQIASPIALTCGDPAGVGPELIEHWLKANPKLAGHFCPIGPASWLERLPVQGIAVGSSKDSPMPGSPTAAGAKIAVEALEIAAKGCLDGRFSGVVTAPLSKEYSRMAGFSFPGQTEFFEARWGGDASMVFSGNRLRVALATWHIPLSQVPEVLRKNPALLGKAIESADRLARLEGIENPRIAVCGLNPHAGENGLLGDDETEWIKPYLDSFAKKSPIQVTGPLPGDTVFYRTLSGEFDVAVALYHDQGLVAVKTLEFDQAVNITLGLPYLRSSPDHGTAFHLAGKGLAKGDSLNRACRWMVRALTLPNSDSVTHT